MAKRSVWRDGQGVQREAETKVLRREAKPGGLDGGAIWLAGLHWYAVRVKHRAETAVAADLDARGFVAVVPMLRQWRRANRYAKRKVEIATPLVTGYVLLGFDPSVGQLPWGRVFELSMVVAVVGEFGIPQRMRGGAVVQFLAGLGEIRVPEWRQHLRKGEQFGVGDMVRVAEGSMMGFTARVHAIEGEAARVLLPLFGKAEQEISLPLANLERAD